MDRTWKLLGAFAVAAVLVTAASSATAPVPVKASSRNESTPAAGGVYFSWAQSRRGHPRRYDVWAQRARETPFKVNAQRTEAFNGGIDGTRLFYQQIRGLQSDIRIFELETRRRTAPPAGVNTRRWEWAPTISGDWLLFGRGLPRTSSRQQIMLQNLVTGERRVLDSLVSKKGGLEAGQVSGNYAVWRRCNRPHRCDVFRYDIAARRKTAMPRTGGPLYAPSVTASGTTYYGRSRIGCGASAELVKTTIDGTTTVLYAFPRNVDFAVTYAVVIPPRPPTQPEVTRVYLERVACSGPRFDVYSLDDVARAPPP